MKKTKKIKYYLISFKKSRCASNADTVVELCMTLTRITPVQDFSYDRISNNRQCQHTIKYTSVSVNKYRNKWKNK